MKKWFCLMLLIGLSACGSADKVFLGYWKAQGNQFGYLHITQNGSGHLMTVYDNSLWDGTLQTKEFPVTLKDNSLTMDVPMGKVTGIYKETDQTLILNGKRAYQQVSEEEAMKAITARQEEVAKAEAFATDAPKRTLVAVARRRGPRRSVWLIASSAVSVRRMIWPPVVLPSW